jgi:hypothetical protein
MTRWRDRKSYTWGKRLVLTILILGATTYGVLIFAARSKEPIRLGLQDYLTQASGHRAEITDMEKVRLAPNVEFRIREIIIRSKDDAAKSLLKADNAYIELPLGYLFIGVRRYLGFEVKNLETASGFFLPKKLTIGYAGISDPSDGKKSPQFMAEGKYNGRDLLVTVDMLRKDRGKKRPYYAFDDSFRLTGKLGVLEGEGVFVRNLTSVMLDDVHVRRGSEYLAVFDVNDIRRDPLRANIAGTVNEIPFTAVIDGDVMKITPGSDKPQDLKTLTQFVDAITKDMGVEDKPESFKFEITTVETEKE